MYVCCVNEVHTQQFLKHTEKLEWRRTRERLAKLSNLKELAFIIQHKQSILDSTTSRCKVFNGRMKTVLKQGLSLQREQGILSISGFLVDRFGPQRHYQG